MDAPWSSQRRVLINATLIASFLSVVLLFNVFFYQGPWHVTAGKLATVAQKATAAASELANYQRNSTLHDHGADCRQPGCWNRTASSNGTAAAAADTTNSSIQVFVGVLSRSVAVKHREVVRATWGTDARLARVMFFMQRPRDSKVFRQVRREAAVKGDVVITSEVYEDYYNITYSVLDIFKTAARVGGGITHVFKTDDDCYPRWSLIIDALGQMPRTWLYAGSPMGPGSVIRTPGWHQVPYSNWASDEPVRYGFGGGYAVSMDLARHIAAGAPHVIMPPQNLLIIEDVAVGYWISHVAKEQNATINYHALSLTLSGQCDPHAMVFHVTSKPQWKTIECMHLKGGQCC